MKLKDSYNRLTEKDRLHGLEIPVVGLTGGIASGKSTVSKLFREFGLKVIDADQLIKNIYSEKDTIEFISKSYPQVMIDDAIDFPRLRKLAFENPQVRGELEKYLYAKLPGEFRRQVEESDDVVIYDVPLLFEKGLDRMVDASICVYAPRDIQVERLVKRDEIDTNLAEKILDAQMDIEEKKRKAEFVIENSASLDDLKREAEKLLQKLFQEG